jgi:hypothetical protein
MGKSILKIRVQIYIHAFHRKQIKVRHAFFKGLRSAFA